MLEESDNNYEEGPEDTHNHSPQIKGDELEEVNFKHINDLGGLALGRIK